MNKTRALKALFNKAVKLHFSQYGEDVFLHKKFRNQREGWFYVDVGAHHPYHLSNTAYLWTLGWNGMNVDASPQAVEAFKKARPDDLNIHAAVTSVAEAQAQPTLTFFFNRDIDNCATCDAQVAANRGLKNQLAVPCTSLLDVIQQACQRFAGTFGLLNIDIEGLDERVIEAVDTWPQKPQVVMIEIYGEDIREVLAKPAHVQLEQAGYRLTQRIGHTAVYELGC